jgi:hypothetical protein
VRTAKAAVPGGGPEREMVGTIRDFSGSTWDGKALKTWHRAVAVNI